MPKIPDYLDYGARPSLRSGRVDMPGQGGIVYADAVAAAAGKFAKIVEERKDQQDKLTYTRLKSELLTEDIRIKRELEEAGEWRTYEDDYRTQIAEARERIQGQITNPHDAVIFDADANLLVERGATSMAELHHRDYLDFEKADMARLLDQSRYDLLAASPYQRRDILQSAQGLIAARLESGILSEEEALGLQREWVRNVAGAELMNMEPQERLVFLKRAIDANLDPNDYKAEQGTGSLADFLPQDVRIELYRKTEKLVEEQTDLSTAQRVTDQAFQMFQADTADNMSNRMRYIRENLTGKARDMAEQMVRERNNEVARVTAARQEEILGEAMANIRAGKGETTPGDPKTRVSYTVNDIPRDAWTVLTPGQQKLLTDYSDAMQQGRSFSFYTQMTKTVDAEGNEMPSYSLWRRMTDEQKVATDLDSPLWLMSFTEQDWRALKTHQDQLRGGSGLTYADGLTNDQMLLAALVDLGHIQQTGRPPDEQAAFARARLEFDRRIQDEMRRQGVAKLPNPERRRILAEVLQTQGYTKRNWIRSDYQDDNMTPVFLMSPEQLDRAFLNIDGARQEMAPLLNGRTITVEELLIAHAMNDPNDPVYPGLGMEQPPGRKDLERAYFAYKAGLGKAEIERRLRGE